jgi:NF-X1-type zinc finger protein NFXL1
LGEGLASIARLSKVGLVCGFKPRLAKGEGLGLALGWGVSVSVAVRLGLLVRLGEGLGLALGRGVWLSVAVRLGLLVTLGEGLLVKLGLGVRLWMNTISVPSYVRISGAVGVPIVGLGRQAAKKIIKIMMRAPLAAIRPPLGWAKRLNCCFILFPPIDN